MTDNDDIVDRLRDIGSDLDVCWEAASEIERLRAEAGDIARWIVDQIGYPADVRTSKPPSAPWQRRIEDIWVEHDGDQNDPDLNEDIRAFVAEEGGWLT